eukprot:5013745-Pyramimonas_sp.AAC.1
MVFSSLSNSPIRLSTVHGAFLLLQLGGLRGAVDQGLRHRRPRCTRLGADRFQGVGFFLYSSFVYFVAKRVHSRPSTLDCARLLVISVAFFLMS